MGDSVKKASEEEWDKVKVAEVPKKEKERRISVPQTLTSLAGNIRKIEKGELCSKEDLKILKEIFKEMKERWISKGMEI